LELIKINESFWTFKLTKGLIVGVCRCNVGEPALKVVFEFNDQLIMLIECLESICPIFHGHVGFLVGINLAKQFLKER